MEVFLTEELLEFDAEVFFFVLLLFRGGVKTLVVF